MGTPEVRLAVVTAVCCALAAAGPAYAGDTDDWSTIDTGVTNTARPGLLRVGDSLDVVWTKGGVATAAMYRRTYYPDGAAGPPATWLSGWNALAADPVPTELGTAVSGLRGLPGEAGFWDGRALLVDGTGSIVGALSSRLSAYVGDHDATVLNARPVYVYSKTDEGKILLHVGTEPTSSGSTNTPGPGIDYEAATGGCCMYRPAIRVSWWIADADTGANAQSQAWLAWYSNSDDTSQRGWLVRSVTGLPGAPSLGPVQQAPGSLSGGGSLSASQRAALAVTPAGVWLAYPVGYPTSRKIRVWQLGTNTTRTYRPPHSVEHVSLASDPSGRLWLAYYSKDTDKVYTQRSNPSVTAWGKPAVLSNPVPTADYLYSTAIDATATRADLVVNSGTLIHHRQSLPVLAAQAKVVKTKGKNRRIIVTVTDAQEPVAGAKVRLSGHGSKVTKASGRVKFTVQMKAGLPKKMTGKAAKTGYYPGRFSTRTG